MSKLYNDFNFSVRTRTYENAQVECSLYWWNDAHASTLETNAKYSHSLCMTHVGMTVNGFNYAAIPSLEKRFHFNSKQTGLMSSVDDISNMILTIIVSFYGSFGNKPRWIGLSVALVSFSLVLFSLPHFMIGKYQPPTGKPLKFFI